MNANANNFYNAASNNSPAHQGNSMKLIYAAFVKAQTGFAPALKTSLNPHFKSRYADLAACVEAVIDSLNANGIGLVQKTLPDDTGVTVETVFVHESGESFSGGPLHVPAAKNDPQGYGSALSYARRYSLMAACGIAPEDDDGNAATKAKNAAKPAKVGVMADVLAGMPELSKEDAMYFDELAQNLEDLFAEQGASIALNRVNADELDHAQTLHLWSRLGSKLRSALKAEKAARVGLSAA